MILFLVSNYNNLKLDEEFFILFFMSKMYEAWNTRIKGKILVNDLIQCTSPTAPIEAKPNRSNHWASENINCWFVKVKKHVKLFYSTKTSCGYSIKTQIPWCRGHLCGWFCSEHAPHHVLGVLSLIYHPFHFPDFSFPTSNKLFRVPPK